MKAKELCMAAMAMLALPYCGIAQNSKTYPNDSLFYLQWSHVNRGNVPLFNATPSQSCGTRGIDLKILPAWEIVDKANYHHTVVGVIDSGLDPGLEDINYSRVVPGLNFTADIPNNDTRDLYPNDTATYGHGTMVTGIIAATVNNRIGIAGVDRSCMVMPLRVSPVNLPVERARIANAIRHAADNGVKVVNMSWGWQEITINNEVREALSYAINKGVIFLAAAGNDDNEEVDFPAKVVISIGAINPCGNRKNGRGVLTCEKDDRYEQPGDSHPWGSNYGKGLDLLAPGTMIPAVDMKLPYRGYSKYTNCYRNACWHSDAKGNYLVDGFGTSIATPLVTGIVSMMAGIKSYLKQSDAEYILKSTAVTVDEKEFLMPNAEAAVNKTIGYIPGSFTDLAVEKITYYKVGAEFHCTIKIFNKSAVTSPLAVVTAYTSRKRKEYLNEASSPRTYINIPAIASNTALDVQVVLKDVELTDPWLWEETIWANAIIDDDMSFDELDKANNARSITMNQQSNLPDFIVTDVHSQNTGANAYTVNYKMKNNGNGDGYIYLYDKPCKYWASQDDRLSADDINIGYEPGNTFQTITPGSSVAFSKSLTCDKPYLLIQVDANNRNAESVETNNLSVIQLNSSLPDLYVTEVTHEILANNSVRVTYKIKNKGNANGFIYLYDLHAKYWASSDDQLSSLDTQIGSETGDALRTIVPGSWVGISETLAPINKPYLLIQVDANDKNRESNESNNVQAVLLNLNPPDFIVAEVNHNVTGTNSLYVSYKMKNTGSGDGFVYLYDQVCKYWASSDDRLSSDDVSIGQETGDGLRTVAPGSWVGFSETLTTDKPYLLIQVDAGDKNRESNELNNIYALRRNAAKITEIAANSETDAAAEPSLRIFPNPARDEIFITSALQEQATVIIRDVMGARKQEYMLPGGSTLPVPGFEQLAAGIYFIEMNSRSGKRIVKKMIKQ